MTILCDTQAWIWIAVAPERFSRRTRVLVADDDNDLLLSAASAWEISIKWALGKLLLPSNPSQFVSKHLATTKTYPLAIEHSHALRVAELPRHHSDPFDRLLIAQAQVENVPVLTADPQFKLYDVEVIRA